MNYNILLTIIKYSILEAVRDKFLVFILLGVMVTFFISLFIGELTIIESTQTQSALFASTIRLFTVFTISLFVITSMIREFNDKGFELILSHSVPRYSYYFGKLSGFSVVALLITLICSACLCFYIPLNQILLWSFSLFCEQIIIISVSLLCLFSFSSITISFSVVMAFYLLSRSIEAIQLISDSPIITLSSVSHQLVAGLLDIIAYVIPNLYMFTRTEWLIYTNGSNAELLAIIGQTLIYVTFLSFVTLFDLYRKEL